MPPRAGQLDEISEAIGKIGAYVHEGRHGINNLSMKMDAMAVEQAKRHDSLKIELSNQMDKIADSLRKEIAEAVVRISNLERGQNRDEGARGLVAAIFKSPIFAWIAAGALSAWALLMGRHS